MHPSIHPSIDKMQFGFVPGRGTINTIFIVRQLQEKYIATSKLLYFAFVNLEKAFDHVPRKVLWWALSSLRVKEWAVRVIQGMYSNAWSHVRVSGQYSKEFLWELMCIRVLSLAHCSSFWCWRHFWASSALVYRGSFFMLMTFCLWRAPKTSVSPGSRHGKLAWRVKGSMSIWRRPSSWSLVMATMFSRNLASTPVMFAVVVSAATPSCAHMLWVHKKCSGIIKRQKLHVCLPQM